MRMPLCSKPGQKRPLRSAEIKLFQDVGYIHYPAEDVEVALITGLITYIGVDDELMATPLGFTEKDPETIRILPEDKPSNWTAEQKETARLNLVKLIAALSPARATTRKSWAQGVWANHRVAHKYQQSAAWKSMAHDFAKKSIADYDSTETDELYNYPVREKGVGYKRLREWADEDTPGWNGPIRPVGPTYIEGKFDLLETKPTLAAVQTWMMGCTAFVQQTEQWYLRWKSNWRPLTKCANNVPFSTKSSGSSIKVAGEDGKLVKMSFEDILLAIKDEPEFKTNRFVMEKYIPYFRVDLNTDVFNSFPKWIHEFKDEVILETDPALAGVFELAFDLCGRDKAFRDYYISWLAACVQRPQDKMPTIVFYSKKQGCGKGIMEDFLTTHVFGEDQCLGLTDLSVLLGHFNSAASRNQLVFCQELQDEGKSIGNSQAWKELQTGKRITTVKKNCEAEKSYNYAKYMVSTNSKYCITIELSDRRTAMAECDLSHVDDADYYSKLVRDIHQKEVGRKMLNFLAQRDISTFIPQRIPMTDLKQDAKERSMHSSFRHIQAICEGKRLWSLKCPNVIAPTALYQDYEQWCRDEGIIAKFKKSSYEEHLVDLEMLNKQWMLRGERVRGYKLDYALLDAVFQKMLKRTTSCFQSEDDDEPGDELADDE